LSDPDGRNNPVRETCGVARVPDLKVIRQAQAVMVRATVRHR